MVAVVKESHQGFPSPLQICLFAIVLSLVCFSATAASLEIDVVHEISLGDGSYIAKEHEGQGRYALINHNHGRFEGGDILAAECSGGYLVSQLPSKFAKLKAALLPHNFVLTECEERRGEIVNSHYEIDDLVREQTCKIYAEAMYQVEAFKQMRATISAIKNETNRYFDQSNPYSSLDNMIVHDGMDDVWLRNNVDDTASKVFGLCVDAYVQGGTPEQRRASLKAAKEFSAALNPR